MPTAKHVRYLRGSAAAEVLKPLGEKYALEAVDPSPAARAEESLDR